MITNSLHENNDTLIAVSELLPERAKRQMFI